MPMTSMQVPLILGCLIYCFDSSLSNCDSSQNLDMSERFGLNLQKEQPVHAIPKTKF